MLAGVADEDAFLEECRQRGQHALPAGTSARPPRPQRPAAFLPKHASPPHASEDEDEPGRHRAAGGWDPSMLAAGVQRGTEAARPRRATSQGQRGRRLLLGCCVLT